MPAYTTTPTYSPLVPEEHNQPNPQGAEITYRPQITKEKTTSTSDRKPVPYQAQWHLAHAKPETP
jgi:hypothetical protein